MTRDQKVQILAQVYGFLHGCRSTVTGRTRAYCDRCAIQARETVDRLDTGGDAA